MVLLLFWQVSFNVLMCTINVKIHGKTRLVPSLESEFIIMMMMMTISIIIIITIYYYYCVAGILSLLSSTSHRLCLAQCWILPELQRQMSNPHRGYGTRTRGDVVGAEGVAGVGMEVVEADVVLSLMLRIAC